ncbi:MAG: hypothetical protein Q4A46_08485 [Clostridia bacterium]|nr:hypothetical protein [Clostridia bacterium]
MKVKHSIIPFIPIAAAMVIFKLMGIFGVDGNGLFLGMNKMTLSYAVIGMGVGLFVICILINIFDRKTASVYPLHKNPVAGALSVLSGVAIIASAVTGFLTATANSEYYYMTIACLVFAIPAGIAFILMSKVHFAGKSAVSGASALFIFPSLWGCSELVYEFLMVTKMSVSSTDLTALFCYIFITLFLFSDSMVLSRIKGRNPVKASFIYGLPAAALGLSYGLYMIFTTFVEGMDISKVLIGTQLVVISLYALSFIVEMTVKSFTKDEIEIIDGLPNDKADEDSDDDYVDTKDYDDLVFAKKIDDDAPASEPSPDYYENTNDFEDFIIGYNSEGELESANQIQPEKEVQQQDNEDDDATDFELKAEQSNKPQDVEKLIDSRLQDNRKEDAEPTVTSRTEPSQSHNSEAEKEPEEELSEIDKILKELDSKK